MCILEMKLNKSNWDNSNNIFNQEAAFYLFILFTRVKSPLKFASEAFNCKTSSTVLIKEWHSNLIACDEAISYKLVMKQ